MKPNQEQLEKMPESRERVKRCSVCKASKPASSFYRNRSAKDGLDSRCKICSNAHTRQVWNSDRERMNAIARAYRNKENSKLVSWKHNIKVRYGATPEIYRELLEKQGGRCKICGIDSPGKFYKYFCFDHDHKCCSGKHSCGKCLRGLLCGKCNKNLGLYENNTEFFTRTAQEYIDSFKT